MALLEKIESERAAIVSDETASQTAFHQTGGNVTTLANVALTGSHFNPSRGILLFYSSYAVLIKGRNLQTLYANLQQQKVKELSVEIERHLTDAKNDKPVVTKIEIRFINYSTLHGVFPDDLFNEFEQAANS